MQKDLAWVKNKYGDDMVKLCRDNLESVLEHEGMLRELLDKYFSHNKFLHEDLVIQNKVDEFRAFIYSKMKTDDGRAVENDTGFSATELFQQAGYTLYPECKTEADIQSFRHYFYRIDGKIPVYQEGMLPEPFSGEELCTFNGNRLKDRRVWFAVHKDADKIKREDFVNPQRQDAYGTSVISIQFLKDKTNTLKITNRYNHTVINADHTFKSNLDNIKEGLTVAFEKEFGVRDLKNCDKNNFELDGYVLACDNRYYPYNYELDGVYYCPNNVIINLDTNEIKKLPTHQILADYFVIDCKNNTIELLDKFINDEFINEFVDYIKHINVEAKGKIKIIKKNETCVFIKLNKKNQIVSFENESIARCGDRYLIHNKYIEDLSMMQLEYVGNNFLYSNNHLKSAKLPKLKKCGEYFLFKASSLTNLNVFNLQKCGDYFLGQNRYLEKLNMPALIECGDYFFDFNTRITNVDLRNLQICGNGFFYGNMSLEKLSLPSLKKIGDDFLYSNIRLENIELPSVEDCGSRFLHNNNNLKYLNLPRLKRCKRDFMWSNKVLKAAYFSSLNVCGNNFLYFNQDLIKCFLPVLESCGDDFMHSNVIMKELNLFRLRFCGNSFMYSNNSLQKLYVPHLLKCGNDFMYNNTTLSEMYAPKLRQRGYYYLPYNKISKKLPCLLTKLKTIFKLNVLKVRQKTENNIIVK